MNQINLPPVVKNLLIINIIFFVAKYLFTSINLTLLLGVFYFDSPLFNTWQPITYMFMHGNISHIFFNMFALYMFGCVLEARWGAKKFIYFYFITGLGALALQMAVQAFEVYQITGYVINPNAVSIDYITSMVQLNINGISQLKSQTLLDIYAGPMVGASGAIFGLLVAFGMLYPNTEMYIMFIPVPIKAKYIIPIYIVIELFLGVAQFKGDSVAHYAHLGGALFGFILVKLWHNKNKDNFYTLYE